VGLTASTATSAALRLSCFAKLRRFAFCKVAQFRRFASAKLRTFAGRRSCALFSPSSQRSVLTNVQDRRRTLLEIFGVELIRSALFGRP